MFKINDKVICLTDFRNLNPKCKIFHPTLPEKGKTYVIRGVFDVAVNCPVKGLYLTGINSLNNPNGREQGFSSLDFQTLKEYGKQKSNFGGEYDYLDL